MRKVVITLRSRKGTEWQLETTEDKVNTVKRNAPKWGTAIVKVVMK